MNKQTITLTTTGLMFALLLLSASYINAFQNWVFLNSSSLKGYEKQVVTPVFNDVGIRSIVSENRLLTPSFSTETKLDNPPSDLLAVKKQTFDENQADMFMPIASISPATFIDESRFDKELGVNKHLSETSNNNIMQSPPLIVELDNEVLVEFSADYSHSAMQKALARLLVLPKQLNADDVISSDAINTSLKPYLYGKALNQYKKPIRYPAQAYRYAEYLLVNHTKQVEDEQGGFTVISIPLTEQLLPDSIKNYQAWVNEYATKYRVSAELIFAIMHVESAFNPRAVSQSNALGLMQVKANAAGRDVYRHIDQRAGQPSPAELFNPKENIRVGTAYMGLLNNLYLKDIRNSENKELVAISAYNGGLSTVLKLFGKTPESAIKRINQLHPRQVYRTLRYTHQSDETKRYIEKVTQAKNRYKELLNFAA
ncbi:MAG: murein transglycosylase domain-containing protein [Thiomicrorhabdus sp.]|nr:murein transglycosylase domain-containing protein [Thiomicrorhabdus sp.]